MNQEFEFIYAYLLYRCCLAKPESIDLEYDRKILSKIAGLQQVPAEKAELEHCIKVYAVLLSWMRLGAEKFQNPEMPVLSKTRAAHLKLQHSYVFLNGKVYRKSPDGLLGRGGFGTVKTVTDIDGHTFALKSEKTQQSALDSIHTQNGLKAQQTAGQLLAFGQRPYIKSEMVDGKTKNYDTKTYKLMPLIPGISFRKVISDHLESMTKSQKYAIFLAVARALKTQLHDKRILHCDIKPENVHIVYDPVAQQFKATFLDLDLGVVLAPGQNSIQLGVINGTEGYKAAEIQADGIYSYASDIYALGRILISDYYSSEIPQNATAEEKRFLKKLVHARSGDRPSVDEVISFYETLKTDAQEKEQAEMAVEADITTTLADEEIVQPRRQMVATY